MSNITLFDRSGRYIAQPLDVLDALTPDESAAVENVGIAAHHVEALTAAVAEAEQQLKDTQAEIAEAEKLIPRQTELDCIRQVISEANARRTGRA